VIRSYTIAQRELLLEMREDIRGLKAMPVR
jgi:hypothetical protein